MTLSVAFRHRFPALDLDIEFAAPIPGVVALFGPSGAGKSSVVAAVAGLFRPSRCRVGIGDTVLVDHAAGIDLPPERRRIGLVFQDARLFPHLSVRTNLRYGLRRVPPGPIGFDEVVDLLGIEHLLGRRPGTLSGGERQRVAIGRALLAQPRLLAMDEPLASLDGARKAEILPFLIRLKTALALPILYVTHAPEEVAVLADTLVLLEQGRVVACGKLAELTSRGDLPIAARDDAGSILPATVAAHDAGRRLSTLSCGGVVLLVPLLADRRVGDAVRVRIPARDLILATSQPGASSVHNVLEGRVGAITIDSAHHAALVEVELPAARLLARVTPDAVDRLQLSPGRTVLALVKSVSIETLPG